MHRKFIKYGLIMSIMIASLLLAMPASATASSQFSGTFDGSEPEAHLYWCGEMSPYDLVGPVQVSVTGNYVYFDVSVYTGVDMAIDIYTPTFNPADTTINNIDDHDDYGDTILTAGVDYYFVIQPYTCDPDLGTWEFVLTGPGVVSGGTEIPHRIYTDTFDGSEPQAIMPHCAAATLYDIVGPLEVAATGNYVFIDISIDYDIDMTAFFYHPSFNPANPQANIVDGFDDDGLISLTAGLQYFVVVSSLTCGLDLGRWEFSLSGVGLNGSIRGSDGRLNPQLGDIDAVLYPGRDTQGDVSMQIYCVNQLTAEGFIAMVITPDDLPDAPVSENTLLLTSDICEGGVEFYALATGGQYAYQVNVGPNIEGTVHEYLFNDLNGTDLIMRTFNLYELSE